MDTKVQVFEGEINIDKENNFSHTGNTQQKYEVNYILQNKIVKAKLHDDERVSALHISLYDAIFFLWNLSGWKPTITPAREILMKYSKIGSRNTYTRIIKELHEFEYIKYEPSHNPHQAIKVTCVRFDTSNKDTCIKSDTGNLIYQEIISYLNEKAGTDFKAKTKSTIKLIDARINEGYSLENFKKVIDNKTAQWKNDPKMENFLRPETLFGTKFESYLNQNNGKAQNEYSFI